MAVLKSRNRLVSFRLSPEEYEALKQVCIEADARSISDFARDAVLHGIEKRGGGGKSSLGEDLATLSARLEVLDSGLKDLSKLIARVLGSSKERTA